MQKKNKNNQSVGGSEIFCDTGLVG